MTNEEFWWKSLSHYEGHLYLSWCARMTGVGRFVWGGGHRPPYWPSTRD